MFQSGSSCKPMRIHNTDQKNLNATIYCMFSFSNNGYGKLALSALTQKLFTLSKNISMFNVLYLPLAVRET
jgi:hypothetical protein